MDSIAQIRVEISEQIRKERVALDCGESRTSSLKLLRLLERLCGAIEERYPEVLEHAA